MVELSITLGLIFSLLSYEIFGLAPGGIIVPGYIALQLSNPEKLAGTLIVSLLTLLVIKTLSNFMFLYGRRQLVICLLVGGIFAEISRYFFLIDLSVSVLHLKAVGWVVPGLIAHWFEKQGIFKTMAVLFSISVVIRLLVILLYNGSLMPN